MNNNISFIFIKESLALVFQLEAVTEEIRLFYFEILKCLIGSNIQTEQPFKISEEKKKMVVCFLNSRYSSDKRINKLIHFFTSTEENEFIYLYQYNQMANEMYDCLKESLKYYNKGCSQEEILCKMEEYIGEMNIAKEMLDEMPYKINFILPIQKVIRGKSDKTDRQCIYCKGFQGDDKGTSFREKAHAIPEALGNKKFIQNEECDICNSYFAENAEEDLSNMLMFNRLKYGIRGKNGYPIFQIGARKYARYFDWEEEDYSKDWGVFEATKTLIKKQRVKGPSIVDIGGEKVDNLICVSYIKDYCPMHAYKALVKCVMGLIGNEKLDVFQRTLCWLRYDNSYHKLPEVAMIISNRIVVEPELYIFERKAEKDYSLPYCYGELRVADQIFVFIIPFCNKDKKTFRKLIEESAFNSYLKAVYGTYELVDFSETSNKCIERMFAKQKEIGL